MTQRCQGNVTIHGGRTIQCTEYAEYGSDLCGNCQKLKEDSENILPEVMAWTVLAFGDRSKSESVSAKFLVVADSHAEAVEKAMGNQSFITWLNTHPNAEMRFIRNMEYNGILS